MEFVEICAVSVNCVLVPFPVCAKVAELPTAALAAPDPQDEAAVSGLPKYKKTVPPGNGLSLLAPLRFAVSVTTTVNVTVVPTVCGLVLFAAVTSTLTVSAAAAKALTAMHMQRMNANNENAMRDFAKRAMVDPPTDTSDDRACAGSSGGGG